MAELVQCSKIDCLRLVRKKKTKTGLRFCSRACADSSSELWAIRRATTRDKLGVDYPLQSQISREKFKKTNLELYGVEHPLQRQAIKEKVKSAVLSKHGIFPVMKSEEYLASHDFAVANQKRRKTMLTSGTLWTSKPEMLLGKILIDEFGEDDVLNQVFIGGKSIDFCVKSLRLYVQMDGVYWHGLKTATTNEKIKETIRRDQELNTWFEDQKELKLFRMSDEQLTYVLQYGLIEELINQLKNTVYNLTFFDCKVPYSR